MIRYECDKCGTKLQANDARRYIVKMEIFAAAGHLEFTEDEVEKPQERIEDVLRELAESDPDDVEDETYRLFRFDLCDTCRRAIIRAPLGRSASADAPPRGGSVA